MASKETIIIEIDDATGDIKVEAEGFTGAGCEAATKAFRDALGTSKENQRKPEFMQTAAAPAVRKAGQK